MRTITHCLLLTLMICGSLAARAQFDPNKVCRIEDGKIIFHLNPKWSEKDKKEITALFDLDSILIARAFRGESLISLEGEDWKAITLKSGIIELSKLLLPATGKGTIRSDDLFLLVDKWMNFGGSDAEDSEIYGINNFEIGYTFLYDKSAWFYLKGFKTAGNVYISGSFNNWSTTANPMKAVESGWTADLHLKPGRYTYKFIADGKWLPDPYNNLTEDDGAGGYNSIVYCTNHVFKLKGYTGSKKVVVTGNFIKWDQKGLPMKKTDDGWELPMWLRDGTYAYKFIVDNKWLTDAANPIKRKDKEGNDNSFISIGEPYLFMLNGYTDAGKVFLAGSFNGWNEEELLMDKTGNGWQLPFVLPAGNYEYKFVVDGQWMTDPENPFSTGSGNSKNSLIALKATHLFKLENFNDAKNVIVTGSFNDWSTMEYKMIKQGGNWIFPLFLRPGKYTYKFIVDGKWIIDPANDLYEPNEPGTNNSVLWIKP